MQHRYDSLPTQGVVRTFFVAPLSNPSIKLYCLEVAKKYVAVANERHVPLGHHLAVGDALYVMDTCGTFPASRFPRVDVVDPACCSTRTSSELTWASF